MNISIIICTRNRADSLARTLHSLREAARRWTLEWELIVVDNGSSDHTLDVMSAFAKEAWCPIRLVDEPRPGVSYAKNRGIREAAGEFLAFTDDDIRITSGWLPAICRAFQWNQAVGVVGGRTELWDPTQFPHCVRTSTVEAEYRWPTGPDFMVGNNMALRATVLDVVGGFDIRLGPGTRVHGAEDNDMVYRILKAGFVGKYIPEALVYHDHRRSVEELKQVRRNYAVGNGAFLMKHILSGDPYAMKMAYWQIDWLIRNRHSDKSRRIPDSPTVIRALLVGAGVRSFGLR